VLIRRHTDQGVPAAGSAPGTASPAAGRPAGLRLVTAVLIAAAALDLTRCSLVLVTVRHVGPAAGLVASGMGTAVVSVLAALGYRAGRRWAAWAALLIGIASAPQASASGFRDPYKIPDVATAALGVLLAVAILAVSGRRDAPTPDVERPCDVSWPGPASPEAGSDPPIGSRYPHGRRSGLGRLRRGLTARRIMRRERNGRAASRGGP
jgi:hypothetical protein